MVEHNLQLIEKMEQARKDFYFQKLVGVEIDNDLSSPSPIDIGDADLSELCSDGENSEAEMECDYLH